MNTKNYEEVIGATKHIKMIGNYSIRKFKSGGNYVIIDNRGDFLVLEKDEADEVCSTIWEDMTSSQEMLN